MKRQIRLYNVLLPIWLMYLWPTYVWLLILPANFLIDSLVLYLSARVGRLPEPGRIWRRHILGSWLIGFLSDFIGAGFVFLRYMILEDLLPALNLVLFPGTTLVSIPGVILAGVSIYWLNRLLTFRKSDLDKAEIHRLCLHLALFTAPYTFLIPLYG